jgi:hypothetical protein
MPTITCFSTWDINCPLGSTVNSKCRQKFFSCHQAKKILEVSKVCIIVSSYPGKRVHTSSTSVPLRNLVCARVYNERLYLF